ncbi:MAG: DUF4262 domain-containing protein [Actinomycetota bacterium]
MARHEDLPDFHIPHADKIDWMIETSGWALEPVAPFYDSDPPRPGYAYSIGIPHRFAFTEIVVFGLTPVAAKGLVDLVLEQVGAGVDIPRGVPLTGLFDNDLRCVFADVDLTVHGHLFETARRWHRGLDFAMVQLLWPDRSGWLPYESGFDRAVSPAQPVIGRVEAVDGAGGSDGP